MTEKEVEQELKKVVLPPNFRVVLTGFGRVGQVREKSWTPPY